MTGKDAVDSVGLAHTFLEGIFIRDHLSRLRSGMLR